MNHRVMKIEQVVRFKGTILIGVLEQDVKVNDPLLINGEPARIFGIEGLR